jgi:hypothetical protein
MKASLLPMFAVLAFFPVVSLAQETAPAKPAAPAKPDAAPAKPDAAAAKPEALIQALYKTDADVFTPGSNKEVSAKFLASTLIKLLVLDAKRAGEEQGAIDFDPLSFSQDERKITKFATKSEIKGDTAVVKATFENHGERVAINYKCVIEATQWRIADVTYEDGTSLVKLLTETE